MGNKLEKIKVSIDKDLDAGYQVLDKGIEKVKVTIDKDLDAGYQVLDKGLEKVKVTIDQDFDKFIKSIGFFQRWVFEKILNSSLVTFYNFYISKSIKQPGKVAYQLTCKKIDISHKLKTG